MSRTLHQLQAEILDLVAPPNWRDMNVTAATLDLTAQDLPRLTLQTAVLPRKTGAPIEHRTRRYELREIDAAPQQPPALDLDAMTDDARARVRLHIEAASIIEQRAMHLEFATARDNAADRWSRLDRQRGKALPRFKNAESAFLHFTRQPLAGERGRALPRFLQTLALFAFIAFALGVLGPTLDDLPDNRSEWLQAEQELHSAGALARWESEAKARCAGIGGPNTGYVSVPGGGIRCTNKHGRAIGKKGQP